MKNKFLLLILVLILSMLLGGCSLLKQKTYYEIPESDLIDVADAFADGDDAEPADDEDDDYFVYTNSRFGYSVDIPTFLVDENYGGNNAGATFESEDGQVYVNVYGSHEPNVFYTSPNIEEMYTDALAEMDVTPAFTNQQDNWYIISWVDQGKIYYEKHILKSDGTENVVVISYPESMKVQYDDMVTRVSHSLKTGIGADSSCAE